MRAVAAVALLLALGAGAGEQPGPISEAVRTRFRLAPFYAKCLMLGDLPVLGSVRCPDAGLVEAAAVVRGMTSGRPELLAVLASNRVRVAIMAPEEQTVDIPEHRDLTPAAHWNARARGLGATAERPAVSGGAENLLQLPGDRYPTECILLHEFAHTLQYMALRAVEPTFDRRLRDLYAEAVRRGLWAGTYAGSSASEYWAEGVQSYFDTNRENDRDHNHVNTREELKAYDPDLFRLIDETLRHPSWRYVPPKARAPAAAARG